MSTPSLLDPPPKPSARLRARLPARELVALALPGLRTRTMRAALSVLGIAIGIAAMVAVVGVSASAQANLLAEIDALGTNLLTASAGTDFLGNSPALPASSAPMVGAVDGVQHAAAIYELSNATVFRSPKVPSEQTGGLGVDATDDDLPAVLGVGLASGRFLGRVAARFPEVVLGSRAAATLQIPQAGGHVMVDIDGHWFVVIGVLRPVMLDSALNSEVFVSLPVARRVLGAGDHPSELYVRTDQDAVGAVADLLAPTANPRDPSSVGVNRPSDALEARAAAKGQFTTLLLGLGAVALLVGAIGIANIMVISVLERRGEIGLRRALGATRRHISVQFLAESALLAMLGGACGLALGAGATEVYAATKHEPFVIPHYALLAALAIGALAGLYPAAKAARLSPTEALRA